MGKLRDRLADGHHLSGLDACRRDDAVSVGLELGVGQLVAGQIERAARARKPALGLVVG
jgi:hypothetical protein